MLGLSAGAWRSAAHPRRYQAAERVPAWEESARADDAEAPIRSPGGETWTGGAGSAMAGDKSRCRATGGEAAFRVMRGG